MAFTILDGNSFISTGAGAKILLPSSADYFKTWNITKLQTSGIFAVGGEWFGAKFGSGKSANNDGIRLRKAGSNSILQDAFSNSSGTTAGGGFTYVESSPVVETQNSITISAITNASPAVVTQNSHGYSDGDILRIYTITAMQQIAGMDFQISSVSANNYTLIGLRASGFANPATAGFTRRISKYNAVDPEYLYVTEITQASSAVVRTSVDPTNYYVVGMKVKFSVPSSFGMYEIDGLTGTITSLSSANYTMTVDINSTSFTAFAFPASSPTNTQRFAIVAPAGAKTQYDPTTLTYTGYNFSLQPFHTGQFTPYMYLAGGAFSPAGEANDIINWMAYKLET